MEIFRHGSFAMAGKIQLLASPGGRLDMLIVGVCLDKINRNEPEFVYQAIRCLVCLFRRCKKNLCHFSVYFASLLVDQKGIPGIRQPSTPIFGEYQHLRLPPLPTFDWHILGGRLENPRLYTKTPAMHLNGKPWNI